MTTYADAEASTWDGSPLELYKFELGPVAYAYTSGDAAHSYLGLAFQPEAVWRTELEQNEEDGAGSLTVYLPAENPVAVLFAATMPSRQVFITVYRAHRGAAGYVVAFTGAVAAASYSDGECTLTCLPDAAAFQRQIPGPLFQAQCNHVLFSQTSYYGTGGTRQDSAQSVGCGIKKADQRTTAAVSAATGLTLTSAAFGSKPDGHFTYGHVELPSGDVRWITAHTGDTLTLAYPADVAAGDVVNAYPGCDGTEATCRTKFSNVINFAGFTKIPSVNPFNTSLT